jgi:hypothetical protein
LLATALVIVFVDELDVDDDVDDAEPDGDAVATGALLTNGVGLWAWKPSVAARPATVADTTMGARFTSCSLGA